ncbi:hypothetical protein HMPREF0758_4667 [Serratia odorifera DSM 4582]|uniref:Uncharacterized protein n=1 Tax=Serratia odorifera DSM 4582 TaxID=667129 RepID=D4E917_SEROD|nr:hypothetical protein HMPREF0758_4667 [Serratia odorifera DSM 4582]
MIFLIHHEGGAFKGHFARAVDAKRALPLAAAMNEVEHARG